ncbi:MAG: DUF3488 and transglutaminase-like domain-containing protein, partial [Pseudohongiellaceae bacterium]
EFIFSQSILVALYSMLCVVLISSALLSLHQSRELQRPLRTFRLASGILGQSIPLMLVLFLFFPRISPLWSVPLQTSGGVTGLSEEMAPGDIGNLARSDELVFRAQFNAQPPPNSELYWRGLTLDLYDGRRWTRNRNRFRNNNAQSLEADPRTYQNWFTRIEYLDNEVQYDVILEPTFDNWIFTLKMPRMQKENLFMLDDYQVESRRNINQRYSYSVSSYLTHSTGREIAGNIYRRNLLLPEDPGMNERSRTFAEELRAGSVSEFDYIERVLDYFREQPFSYTLSPALLGEHAVDDFLFSTREGFCEHYASTFAFLMRAAGIPSRIVTGYLGGELNPYDSTLTIRQYDAHAWTEVWLESRGWIRVDPTAAVAPQRINLGSEFTFQTEESFLQDAGFSLLRFKGNRFFNTLRLRLETLDYAWNRMVLNYNQEQQLAFLGRFFDNINSRIVIISLLVSLFCVIGLAALLILQQPARKPSNAATRLYLGYCRMLAGMGLERATGETPWNYCQRLCRIRPQWQREMKAITDTYVDIAFCPQEDDRQLQQKTSKLRKRIRQFRLLK